MLDKFRNKLPKDELKRLGKEVAKKLVASDYKNGRVDDPSAPLSDKQAKKIRQYVHTFLDKAVHKYGAHHKKDQGDAPSRGSGAEEASADAQMELPVESMTPTDEPLAVNGVDDSILSDAEDSLSPNSADRKRKREGEVSESACQTPTEEGPDTKRLKENEGATPPPPPPPPPEDTAALGSDPEQKWALQEQEEALMRENEEAQRLEDEAMQTKRMEVAAEDMQREIDAANSGKQEVLSH